jgi:hypothetical protein
LFREYLINSGLGALAEKTMRLFPTICLAAAIAATGTAMAQEEPGAAAEATAPLPLLEWPAVRVGRLSQRFGTVSLRGTGESGWTDAEINQPVFAGRALRTDPHSRAEIRIGRERIAISGGTEIEIVALSDRITQIAVSRGRIGFGLRQPGEGESVEIDFPRGGVWLAGPGDYDIETGSGEQPSGIAVFEGAARFVGGGNDMRLETGNTAVLTGSDTVAVETQPAMPDGFAEWWREQGPDETRLVASYYVSPNMTGFAELDAAGSWKITSEHGAVWVPEAVPEDWVPYRDGHWSWITPWGWTWIDDRPWGFAPSHYGRWTRLDEHWAWVPGDLVAQPAYAPAVVAFLGTPGVGLSSSDGPAVGWFPLAPGEAYWPSYSRDLSYVRKMNFGNIDDIGKIRMQADGEPPLEVFNGNFANRQYASVVARSVFLNGRPVAPVLVTLPEQRLRNAPVLMGSPQIVPPSAQRIARAPTAAAQTVRKNPPADRVTVADSRKGAAKPIRTASMQQHSRGQPAVIRGGYLHAPSYTGSVRGRQAIVLRVAHLSRDGAGKGSRR